MLIPTLWLAFLPFYDVIWWIYAYDFNNPIYQSILFYTECTFCALFKKSFCPLSPWVVKIFFSKSLSVLPFLFEFLIHWESIMYIVRKIFNSKFSTWTANCPSTIYSMTVFPYCWEVPFLWYIKYSYKRASVLGSPIPSSYLSIPASINVFKRKTLGGGGR